VFTVRYQLNFSLSVPFDNFSSQQSNYRHTTCSTPHKTTCHALSTQAAQCQMAHSGPNTIFCTRFTLLDLLKARTFFVRRHILTTKDREPGRLHEDIPSVPCSDSFNLSCQIGYRFTNCNTHFMSSLGLNRFEHYIKFQAATMMGMCLCMFCVINRQVPTFHHYL